MNLPIVETGWNYAGQMYGQVKQSNNILHWALAQAESSLNLAFNSAFPIAQLFSGPILTLDKFLCHSLDTVEEKIPAINLPPEVLYTRSKQSIIKVGDNIIRPILKRADSVKQIGSTVLDSKYTVFAADKLEGALAAADKYVDKYLPAHILEAGTEENDAPVQDNHLKVPIKTIHHMDRFSRKLQRRLTKLTLAEAKVLKERSTDAIHVLAYAVEVLATDPKLAHQKIRDMWYYLSNDEPENQARPQNVEELFVMLTRESARKFVHLVNYTHSTVNSLPRRIWNLTRTYQNTTDNLMKNAQQLGNLNQVVLKEAKAKAHNFTYLLYQLNLYTTELLEHVAKSLEEQEHNIKTYPPTSNQVHFQDRFRTHTSTITSYKTSYKHNNLANGSDSTHI